MGYGDALMATAQARTVYERTGKRVAFGDGQKIKWGRPEQEVFKDNPHVVAPDNLGRHSDNFVWVENYSGFRPYIDRAQMVREFHQMFPTRQFTMKERIPELPWRFTDYRIRDEGPGLLYLTGAERRMADKLVHSRRGFAVIEPGIKGGASPNKLWLSERWQEVAKRLGMPLVQFNPQHHYPLPDAIPVSTPTFRVACAVLSRASIYIGSEGGLHHAAAALGVPSVVYYGGYISPQTTGYDSSHALWREHGSPCGMRTACKHCLEIAEDIKVSEALDLIERIKVSHGR